MKKLVVDTNIVFSAILNTESNIGDLFLNSDDVFIFYSSLYLRQEIENHKDKLIQTSKLSELQLFFLRDRCKSLTSDSDSRFPHQMFTGHLDKPAA